MTNKTRREFLTTSAAAAAAYAFTGCKTTKTGATPEAEFLSGSFAAAALDAAQRAGAEYADAREVFTENESVSTREKIVLSVQTSDSAGLGVRVLVKGHFGFAAARVASLDEAAALGRKAVNLAKSAGGAHIDPAILAPAPRVNAQWTSPYVTDPFAVPLQQKIDACLSANEAALSVPGCSFASSSMRFVKERKLFMNTDGSLISQMVLRGIVTSSATAVDRAAGIFENVGIEEPSQMGFEIIEQLNFNDMARRAAEDAARRVHATPVEAGEYDLILMPDHLWLTIHESIGHPTELDRARGLEANYFGTSFLTPGALKKMRVGSDKVNIVADRLQKHALASVGYDDDGVAAGEWPLISNGIFVGYQTTREQARWIGEPASRGCSYGEGWQNIAFQRMPNVSLRPGDESLTLNELIENTTRGILISGDASYSIDQQRRNFQFTGNSFFRIRDGRVMEPLRDVAYQSNTPDFWKSCDAICDKRFYEVHGSFFDGKGQPGQSNPVSHGSSPARFKNIRVLNTKN